MTEKPVLIGLVGYAQHGKSTVADFLKNMGFIEYAFADPLKKVVMNMFGFTVEQCYDGKLKEEVDNFWGITPRQALIAIGELNADPQIPNLNLGSGGRLWIRKFEHEFEKNEWKNTNVVVSDIRHENEALAVKKLGGLIVRVHNPHVKMDDEFRKSASEQRIKNIRYDAVIFNDSTKEELHNDVASIYNMLLNTPQINSDYETYIDRTKEFPITYLFKKRAFPII